MSAKAGYFYGVAGYLWWGLFPLFFALLAPVNPLEIVPWRVCTALICCLALVAVLRAWRPVGEILRSPRLLGWFTLSALLLYSNWTIFVAAIVSGNVIEAALGYFINPLVTVVLGVGIRRERLTGAQWVAVAIAAVGVAVSAVAYGSFPWLALGLALSFGLYGAVRKHASEDIDTVSGLTVETMIVFPVAIVQMIVFASFGMGIVGLSSGNIVLLALLLSGPITAIPLLLFGAANRRLPLTHLGFIQFLTPIMGFLIGMFVFHETMPMARWIGFGAVWVALVILISDMVMTVRRSSRVASAAQAPQTTGEIATIPTT